MVGGELMGEDTREKGLQAFYLFPSLVDRKSLAVFSVIPFPLSSLYHLSLLPLALFGSDYERRDEREINEMPRTAYDRDPASSCQQINIK